MLTWVKRRANSPAKNGAQGCTFPNDLRPFGCTAYICRYMYAKLDRPTLTRIKRLVREMEERHTEVLRRVSADDSGRREG